MLTQDVLFDLALRQNLVPDAMFYMWDFFGDWQRSVCDHFGGPENKTILDIGCGPLRFGAKILPDIGNGRYYGVEPFGPYVAIANDIIDRMQARDKATVIHSGGFDIPVDIRADFAMCHAVFTHLSHEQIMECLVKVGRVMRPNAPMVFTYNLSGNDKLIHTGRLYAAQAPFISAHLDSDQVFRDYVAENGGEYFRFDTIPHPGQSCGMVRFRGAE